MNFLLETYNWTMIMGGDIYWAMLRFAYFYFSIEKLPNEDLRRVFQSNAKSLLFCKMNNLFHKLELLFNVVEWDSPLQYKSNLYQLV